MDGMHLYGWPIVSKVASFGWKNRKISTSVSSTPVGNRGVTGNRNRGDYIQRGGLVKERSFVEIVKGSRVGVSVKGEKGKEWKEENFLSMNWNEQVEDKLWL